MADTIEHHIRQVIRCLGEDPNRPGLIETPQRVEEAFSFFTDGYHRNLEELLNDAFFEESYNEMVVVKDIDFYSLCEHHLLPFYGMCHVAYVPQKKIIGLSKIPRIIEMFSRRLQLQERLTVQISSCLDEILNPRGVAVIMEGFHLCLAMRGVEKQNAKTTTSSMLGIFQTNDKTREEFMRLINNE